MVRTYTSCPVDYDGFGTTTVRVAGKCQRGKDVRLVETPEAHADWQRSRYWSGGIYMVADEPEWNKLVGFGLVTVAS